MEVREAMNTNVKTIKPSSDIKKAAGRMARNRIGSLIVVEEGKLVGIITENDILRKVVAKNRDSAKTKVKDIMTKNVILIRPDADLEEACRLMKKHKIKKLPVLEGNHLIGIITATDIVSAQPKMMERLGQLFLGMGKERLVAG